jgi:hypothetical protein
MENLFKPEDVISVYSDKNAVEDGALVAINRRDRVTRPVWSYLWKHTPMTSQPPNRWPVDMMGWFRAGAIKKDEALKLIAKHGAEAQKKYEEEIRDKKAAALAGGIISTHSQQARRVYEGNIGGGIYCLWAVTTSGVLSELSATETFGDKLWLIPNENGGVTLMFPEDY